MAGRKREMTNSPLGARELLAGAMARKESPIKLDERELAIFDEIVKAREFATWTDYDVRVAANLARVERRCNDLNDRIDFDGYSIINDRGTRVANPEVSILKETRLTAIALARQLGLSAHQRALSGPDQGRRNNAEKATRDVIQKASSDDLV